MHIVRSDQNGDTSVVTIQEMRAELDTFGGRYDAEVRGIENVTILLFSFEGTNDHDEIALVVPNKGSEPGDGNSLTFTIREAPVCTHSAGMVPNDAKRWWECELGCGYHTEVGTNTRPF